MQQLCDILQHIGKQIGGLQSVSASRPADVSMEPYEDGVRAAEGYPQEELVPENAQADDEDVFTEEEKDAQAARCLWVRTRVHSVWLRFEGISPRLPLYNERKVVVVVFHASTMVKPRAPGEPAKVFTILALGLPAASE